MNELLKFHKKYPEIIESQIDMSSANSRINLYYGKISVISENRINLRIERSTKSYFD